MVDSVDTTPAGGTNASNNVNTTSSNATVVFPPPKIKCPRDGSVIVDGSYGAWIGDSNLKSVLMTKPVTQRHPYKYSEYRKHGDINDNKRGRRNRNNNNNNRKPKEMPPDAPKNGEPEVRKNADGVEEKFCTKCFKPKWRSGTKAHTTSEHKYKRSQNMGCYMQNNIVQHGVEVPTQSGPGLSPSPTLVTATPKPPTPKPSNTLSIDPGFMFSDEDEEEIHFNTTLDVDPLDDDDIFVDASYELDPFIANLLNSKPKSTKVCYDNDDDDVFYDCVDGLSDSQEGECDEYNHDHIPLCLDQCKIMFANTLFMLFLISFAFAIIITPRSLMTSMSILLMTLMPPVMKNLLDRIVLLKWFQSGPVRNLYSFAYPSKWLILSCCMLTMGFVSLFLGFNVEDKGLFSTIFVISKHKKPPDKSNKVGNQFRKVGNNIFIVKKILRD